MSPDDTARLENDLAHWRGAIGRREVHQQRLELESLRRYALATGGAADADVMASPPPLAHWAFFLPMADDTGLGPDGHPARGGFLPAISLPRRMFAAAEMLFPAPLRLGEPAEMIATIIDIRMKAGRSGPLVFVEVERRLEQAVTVRVVERQTYVYREAEAPAPLPAPATTPLPGEVWRPGPVELFRFSAATFNSHRIHYDLNYAQQSEGYPALVVQGPLVAARLAGLAAKTGAVDKFAFRALAPMFADQPIHLAQDGAQLTATRCDGVTAMTATAD
ncbi:hypothetical protein [Polymorphobacter sp.]|uniref:hypothetical protein n=1 Tax=Polymorphobacter sp. TaxID=1909290 RepID=UPI003F70C180